MGQLGTGWSDRQWSPLNACGPSPIGPARSAVRELAAVFVHPQDGRGRRVEAVRLAIDGNLGYRVDKLQDVRLHAQPFVPYDQNRLMLKREAEKFARVGRLFERHEGPAFVLVSPQNGRERAVLFDADQLDAV